MLIAGDYKYLRFELTLGLAQSLDEYAILLLLNSYLDEYAIWKIAH